MPESECSSCKEKFDAPTDKLLQEYELAHHIASTSGLSYRGEPTLHNCRGFIIQAVTGKILAYRVYSHDKLHEEHWYDKKINPDLVQEI